MKLLWKQAKDSYILCGDNVYATICCCTNGTHSAYYHCCLFSMSMLPTEGVWLDEAITGELMSAVQWATSRVTDPNQLCLKPSDDVIRWLWSLKDVV